jgi:TIR domain
VILKPGIFVTHEPEDQTIADELCAALESHGFACWSMSRLALKGIAPERAILLKIESCCVMLVLLSARSDLSPLIERRVAHAILHRVAILPLRLSESSETSNLEGVFDRRQCLDLFPPPIEPHVERVLNAIQRLTVIQRERASEVCPEPDEPAAPQLSNWRGDLASLDSGEGSVLLAWDSVTFAAFAPATIAPLQSFVLDVWAHTAAQSKDVAEEALKIGRGSKLGVKREVSMARGTVVGVVLEIPTLHIPDPIDSLVWHGQPSNASFIVEVPSDAAYGTHTGRAIITASAIPVTKLIFSLLVSPQAPVKDAAPIPATECTPRTAFASYSSRDRAEVLARVQGMHKIRPELDVFIDVISLRAGQQWEEEIGRHVRSDDIFFLFWSEHAAASREVEKEWRLALAERGIDYIDPVPLSDPAEIIPPRELQALHFNDYYLAHIKLNQRRRKGSSERKLWWKFW